jgi:GNAT superfamily N-acetyltransferase
LPTPRLLAPALLAPRHDIERFSNGRHASLDDWLHQRARASEGLSARTYVSCTADPADRVVGYYAISTAVARRVAMPSAKLRKGMPEDIPLLLIGRLAVDAAFQGRGLGAALLADALRRCAAAASIAGVRGVIAHAIDEEAVRFYQRHGFQVAPPLGERAVLLPIEALRLAIGGSAP